MLTMTVNVHEPTGLALSDSTIRRSQYRTSIARWCQLLDHPQDRLVLAENSGADMQGVFGDAYSSLGGRCHVLECPPPTRESVARGKGAMEAEMIDYVVARLPLSQQDLVTKVTGRLLVVNFGRIHPRDLEPASAVVRGPLGGGYVDTRVLSAHAVVWQQCLAGMNADVDDREGIYLEHVVSDRLNRADRLGQAHIRRFRSRPKLIGSSGTSGNSYSSVSARGRRVVGLPIEAALRALAKGKEF